MIKVKGKEVHIEGSSSEIVNEVAGILNTVCKHMGDKHKTSYDDVMTDIIDLSKVHKLTDSGMASEEAIQVLGLGDRLSTTEPTLDDAMEKAKKVMTDMINSIKKDNKNGN